MSSPRRYPERSPARYARQGPEQYPERYPPRYSEPAARDYPDDQWVEWTKDEGGSPTFARRFTARPNMGTWIGVLAMFTFLVATALPWYSVVASVDPFIERTTIIEFDGLRGLTVDQRLKDVFDFSMPSFLLPVTVIVAIALLFRLRSLFKAPTPGKRAWTFVRSTIGILLPLGVAVFIISQVPSFVPPDAPSEIQHLGQAVGSRPFGGTEDIHVTITPGQSPLYVGEADVHLEWGFGPAVYVMLGAVALYFIAASIEMGASRRLKEEGY